MFRFTVLLLGLAGVLLLSNGTYTVLKALLSQALLERAWERSLANDNRPGSDSGARESETIKPWPWQIQHRLRD